MGSKLTDSRVKLENNTANSLGKNQFKVRLNVKMVFCHKLSDNTDQAPAHMTFNGSL